MDLNEAIRLYLGCDEDGCVNPYSQSVVERSDTTGKLRTTSMPYLPLAPYSGKGPANRSPRMPNWVTEKGGIKACRSGHYATHKVTPNWCSAARSIGPLTPRPLLPKQAWGEGEKGFTLGVSAIDEVSVP